MQLTRCDVWHRERSKNCQRVAILTLLLPVYSARCVLLQHEYFSSSTASLVSMPTPTRFEKDIKSKRNVHDDTHQMQISCTFNTFLTFLFHLTLCRSCTNRLLSTAGSQPCVCAISPTFSAPPFLQSSPYLTYNLSKKTIKTTSSVSAIYCTPFLSNT